MTRPFFISAVLLTMSGFAPACSEPGASGPDPITAPKPAPLPAPSDPAAPPDQPAGECTADVDCTVTALPPAPVASKADCCFPTCQKRVAPRKQVDDLQAAFGATCKAVLCAPQNCPTAADPVPVCREGRCIANP
jgi:hypothetical protein